MRGRGAFATFAAAAACLSLLAAPVAASADWTAPLDLAAPFANSDEPHVAIDADGDAVFTWTLHGSDSRIQGRARAANGTLGAVQTLSGAGQPAQDPQVAVDADGDAVFTWERFDGSNFRVQARALNANGTLGAVRTLSGEGRSAFDLDVAVDANGDAIITWRRFDGSNILRIQARARAANGTLGPVQTLSGGGHHAGGPAPGGDPAAPVAVDADGDAVVTWERSDGSNSRIQARALAANGTLGAVQTLSDAGRNAVDPQVAVDADDDAVIAWERFDGSTRRIQARARAANGTLDAVQTLSASERSVVSPQVAVDADGDAVFTWERDDGSNLRVQARARAANGTLSAVQTLSGDRRDANRPQVAVDADGDAVFIWERLVGPDRRIQARTRTANGTLTAVQTVSDAGHHAHFPQLAVDPDGDAVATWMREGGPDQVQASFGP